MPAKFGAKIRCLTLVSAILFPLHAHADQSNQRLLFGVVPQQSATRLAKIWIPFLNEVSAKSGLDITFTTAKDIPTFEKCLSSGAYDLSYMNPYHYVEFHKSVGYVAFAHQRGKKLKGILVSRKDRAITALEDLNDADLAFPSPAAFGASVLPRAEMKLRQIRFRPHYVKSHDSVYRAVAAGIYPAGGGVVRTFNSLPAEVREQLHVFHETKGYTPHAFAAHPRVEASLVARIAEAMMSMKPDAPVLKPLGMAGIDQASDGAWDDIRALNLTRDQTEIVEGQSECRSD